MARHWLSGPLRRREIRYGSLSRKNLADARVAVRRIMRMREAPDLRRRLDAVIATVDALHMPWGVWADTVRQDVEAPRTLKTEA